MMESSSSTTGVVSGHFEDGENDERQEEWFEPAENATQLDILLKSVNSDCEDDVSLKYDYNQEYQDQIAQLRNEVEEFKHSTYLEDFDQVVRDDMLMIGSLSKGDLEAQELQIKQEQIKLQQKQIFEAEQRKKELSRLTEDAKKRVWHDTKKQQEKSRLRDEEIRKKETEEMERMKKAFRHSENQLQRALQLRKAEVESFYGDLMLADNQFGGSKGRRWRVEWTKTPQPIQVKLQVVRGIRDKVPAGRYVLMVSLYDRLGGHALRWSKLAGQQWGGATLPVNHDGNFASSELSINQSVFTVLPPQRSVQPGMILAFELFLLRGSTSPTDKVVAWGCFPICDGQFQIIQGYYKLPLLRGFMDHRITKHTTIERLISSDIDHWMANLYIQVVRLPRYLSGQKEYEVELQFTSGLLSFPDRIVSAEESVDGEKLPSPSEQQLSTADDTQSTSQYSINLDKKRDRLLSSSSSSGFVTKKGSMSERSSSLRKRKLNTKYNDDISSLLSQQAHESDDLVPVDGYPGMYYKLHQRNPIEDYMAKYATTLLPQTPLLNKPHARPTLTHNEDLERHTFSLLPPFYSKGRMQRLIHERAEFVGRMFLSEMGFSRWTTMDFWITILFLIVIWFFRIYIHYCGQWLLLQAYSLPVSSFVFFTYTVNLNYQSDLLSTGEEIGVVVLGPMSNIVIQILFVLISWISQLFFGNFPLLFSKFIMAFSLWVVVSPVAILVVDSALGRYVDSASQPIGDAYKLYWHFYRIEGSGVFGIPLTIFLYLILMFSAIVILYLYFLKLHNNGRMLDVFHRLHGDEDCFFLPHDLELSNQELSFVVKKAEQWRGSDGERRKVTVYDYIWGEEGYEENCEITTHVAIHTLHLDGLRQLYRHFLRLPDGAIVEIFGELGSTNLSPDVKTALLKKSNTIENVIILTSEEKTDSIRSSSLTDVRFRPELAKKQSLAPPSDFKERPLTSESLRTRETIRCDSSDSSSDHQLATSSNA